MECTQTLGCTQQLYETQSEKPHPEQIGFLGICGKKYPVKKGPNKIGRDPSTCDIILNLNSISRQHAVINVLDEKQYMIMDLDSANKTKLKNKIIPAYIPYPIRDGDMLQFGDVFGVFRLLEDENDLPMTQALDIPDTPIFLTKPNLKSVHSTTVPESPDVSDKEDSFIAPSQPKRFKSTPTNHFVKPTAKISSVQSIGSRKLNNVYCTSLKPNSVSTYMDESTIKINEFSTSLSNNVSNVSGDNIYNLETETISPAVTTNCITIPESIYVAETQRPEVCKIDEQIDMQFDFAYNKENDDSIFNAETQVIPVNKDKNMNVDYNFENKIISPNNMNQSLNKNASDEEIIFNEIESQSLVNEFQSQCVSFVDNGLSSCNSEKLSVKSRSPIADICTNPEKHTKEPKLDTSTDLEDIDIELSQKIELVNNDDITDFEDDDLFEDKKDSSKSPKASTSNLADMETQFIDEVVKSPLDIPFEDMLTQIIPEDKIGTDTTIAKFDTRDIKRDVPIQKSENKPLNNCPTKIDTTFKMPVQSPMKMKRKDSPKLPSKAIGPSISSAKPSTNDDRYYNSTQEVLSDLCSQAEFSPEVVERNFKNKFTKENAIDISKDRMVDKKPSKLGQNSSENTFETKICTNNVGDLQIVKSVTQIGARDSEVVKVSNVSDSSYITPVKKCPVYFETNLPSSQEIKTSVTQVKSPATQSSSESEYENSEEQYTPILFKKKKGHAKASVHDIVKKLDVAALPTKALTRKRKPTEKVRGSDEGKFIENVLKPKFLAEHEEEMNTEIINENIKKLKHDNTIMKSDRDDKGSKNTTKSSKTTLRENKNENKKSKCAMTDKQNLGRVNTDKYEKKHCDKQDTNSRSSRNESGKTYDKNTKCEKSIDTAVEITKSKRGRKKKEANDLKGQSPDPIRVKWPIRSSRKKVEEKIHETVRRSSRQRACKEKDNELKEQLNPKEVVEPKSILKKSSSDLSIVYNNSVGERIPDTFSSKRSAAGDDEAPSPKKTRSQYNIHKKNSKNVKVQRVLFTAFDQADEVTEILKNLGAVVVSDVLQCTVLITTKIKRTFKLLCAVALGIPIVGREWVDACVQRNGITDPWLYLIKDEFSESRFGFNLRTTLTGKRQFLKGYNVSATPKVVPVAAEMKLLVECSGGSWKEGGSNWLCLSCVADKNLWAALRQRGATILQSEFILKGVLDQKVDIDGNRL